MGIITITLNGHEVSGESGMTILDLARESGIDIPTLCHDPNLVSIGACRICIVEDERTGALMSSCVTPIASGMVINTHSQKVNERRAILLKLMLASHPDTCMVCDKGNRCDLRKIATDMGIGFIDFQRIPQVDIIEEVNPFIQRDLSKCILCAKCIRADQELVVEGAIDYLHRGFISRPATLYDQALEKSECTFCGTCVAICPTGALSEREKGYRGTAAKTIRSVCPYCGCGCGISLEVKDNYIIRCMPDKENLLNHGTLCVRGSYGYDFVHNPERLTKPLVKTNGEFKPVTWEEALSIVAKELQQIKKKHGPDSLAVLGSSKCTNEENYLLQKYTRCVLGTNNIDNGSRLYSADSSLNLSKTIGFFGTTAMLDEIEKSEMILVAGANPQSSAPLVGYAIKRAIKYKGAKLILINPLQTKLTLFADVWLRPHFNTDVVLYNGLARIIIDEDLLDKKYLTNRMIDFDQFTTSLENYTLRTVEKITGVPAQEIQKAARLFASADRACIVFGNGVTQQINGADCIIALANLAMLRYTENDTRCNIYVLQKDSNGQGACDMGVLPGFLPGYQALEDDGARKIFESRWGCQLPSKEGMTALEFIPMASAGIIKGMYIVGENPVLSFPKPSLVKQALESLDFLIVQDMFLTETAKLAKVVLPASSFAEKRGTFTNFEGRLQKLHQAIPSLGDSLPDWRIIIDLSNAMGYSMPYASPDDVMMEIKEMVTMYRNSLRVSTGSKDSQLTSRRFQNRYGTGSFFTAKYTPQKYSPSGYFFTLIAGSILNHFGSGTRSSRASRLKKSLPEAFVEISKPDADFLNINNGERVRISSPSGEMLAYVRINEAIGQGIIFMPISFPDSPVMSLFDYVFDPRSKTPALKTCAVKLERIDRHG